MVVVVVVVALVVVVAVAALHRANVFLSAARPWTISLVQAGDV